MEARQEESGSGIEGTSEATIAHNVDISAARELLAVVEHLEKEFDFESHRAKLIASFSALEIVAQGK